MLGFRPWVLSASSVALLLGGACGSGDPSQEVVGETEQDSEGSTGERPDTDTDTDTDTNPDTDSPFSCSECPPGPNGDPATHCEDEMCFYNGGEAPPCEQEAGYSCDPCTEDLDCPTGEECVGGEFCESKAEPFSCDRISLEPFDVTLSSEASEIVGGVVVVGAANGYDDIVGSRGDSLWVVREANAFEPERLPLAEGEVSPAVTEVRSYEASDVDGDGIEDIIMLGYVYEPGDLDPNFEGHRLQVLLGGEDGNYRFGGSVDIDQGDEFTTPNLIAPRENGPEFFTFFLGTVSGYEWTAQGIEGPQGAAGIEDSDSSISIADVIQGPDLDFIVADQGPVEVIGDDSIVDVGDPRNALKSVKLGDFDGDGRTDMLMASREDTLDGFGQHLELLTYGAEQHYAWGWRRGVGSLNAIDVDLDGADDLFASDDFGTTILFGTPGGDEPLCAQRIQQPQGAPAVAVGNFVGGPEQELILREDALQFYTVREFGG